MRFPISFIDPSTVTGQWIPLSSHMCVGFPAHLPETEVVLCAGPASFPTSMGSSAVLLSCRSPHLLHRRARAQELPASEAPPSENQPQGQKGEVGRKHL